MEYTLQNTQSNQSKWYVLSLSAATNALAVAVPSMALSVLLPEISADLHLDLVQAGVLWGIGSLPIIFSGLAGGLLGDRFGAKPVLVASCLLIGLTGALRAFSGDFLSLAVLVFLFGVMAPVITMNNIKLASERFSNKELGFANGVLSMGMALGFLIGALISATLLSPRLGGWRNVFVFYGGIALLLAIPWYFVRPANANGAQPQAGGNPKQRDGQSVLAGLWSVARIRDLLLLGLAITGISGSIQGLLGYLPLYLRGLGWPAASADSALGAFHTISLIFVLPISLWSDRLGSRKRALILTATFTALGIGLLSVLRGTPIWAAVLIAGFVRDGFMAIFLTVVIETPGVKLSQAGTATGFMMIFMGIGNLLAPPLGNALAGISPAAPFALWSALAVLGILFITRTRTA